MTFHRLRSWYGRNTAYGPGRLVVDAGLPAPTEPLPLRLMLRFADADYEKRFLTFYTDFYYRYAQWSLALGLVLLVGDFLVDHFAHPEVWANVYRLVVGIPIVAAGLALSYARITKKHWEAAMTALIALLAFVLFRILLDIDAEDGQGLRSWVGILNYTILELYCFVILGVRFSHALVGGILILVGFEFSLALEFGSQVQEVVYLTYHVMTMFMIAAGLGWWREFLLRQDFVARTDLEAARLATEESRRASESAALRREHALSLVEATLEASDNGILVVNLDGTVVSANKRFAEMLRVPEELIASGDDAKILTHVLDQFDNPAQFLHKVEVLYAKPDAVSRDNLEFSDGRVYARFSHPQMLHGEIVGRVWSFLDISDQVRSEQRILQLSRAITEELERSERQREELQTLLNSIPDLVWMKDPDGLFLFCNPAFEKLIGASVPEILGKSDLDFFLPAVAAAFRADDRAAAEQSDPLVRDEWVTYNSDGHKALLETVKAAVRGKDGKLHGVISIARDVTRMRTLLEELKSARSEAMQSNDAKSMFLASMSHELRTPLNAIIGFAQMLDLGVPIPLEATQREAVGHILNSGRHLLSLINEVLDLTRIEAGKLDLTFADMALTSVIREAVTLTSAAATSRRITIRNACPDATLIHADASRVRQVLLNLLSNAVKYNRDEGQIVVSCHTQGELVRISVVDTGPGIPEQRQAQLFQPFQRLGAERTATEGTGIGLVVCKKLVEAMYGRIGFESEAGVGSRFWVELPLARSAAAAAKAGPTTTAMPREVPVRGRVLYVEDNPVNSAVMQFVFEQMLDAELLTAESAESGLELIRANPPDLVLMDINLPGMSGLDALKKLKADPHTAVMPVVAVSAAAMPHDVQHGLDAGFLAYLTKPFDVPELVSLVIRILGASARRREQHEGNP